MKEPTVKENYRIDDFLKESIKKSGKYKSLSSFMREAINELRDNPLGKEEVHDLNGIIKQKKLKQSTVQIFIEDHDTLIELQKENKELYYDKVYLTTIALYNYAIKEKLI
jgi:Arc/MetJ-type ribon-helix-helix transcriptional regulator